MTTNMRQVGGRLFKESLIYGAPHFLQKAVGFFMLPLYTALMLPADYGIIENVNVAVFFLAVPAMLHLPQAMMRWHLFVAENDDEREAIIGTAVKLLLVSGLAVCGLMLFVRRPMAEFIFGSADARFIPFIWIVSASTFLAMLFQFRIAYNRTLHQVKQYAVQQFVFFGLSLVCQVSLVIYMSDKAMGALLGSLIALGLLVAYSLPWLWRETAKPMAWKYAWGMLAYGLPMVPGSVALWVINSSNRIVLARDPASGLAEVGLYGVAAKLASVFALFSSAFLLAWNPTMFELARKPEGRRLIGRTATYYFCLMLFAGLGIAVFSGDVLRIMTAPAFHPALELTPYLVFGAVAFSLYTMFGAGIAISGKNYWTAIIYGAGAAVCLGLSIWWAPLWHGKGAAGAYCAATVATFLFFVIVNQKVYPLEFEYARLLKAVAAAALAFGLYLLTVNETGLLGIMMRAGVCLAFLLLLLAFRFVRVGDIALAREYALKLMRGRGNNAVNAAGDKESLE